MTQVRLKQGSLEAQRAYLGRTFPYKLP